MVIYFVQDLFYFINIMPAYKLLNHFNFKCNLLNSLNYKFSKISSFINNQKIDEF